MSNLDYDRPVIAVTIGDASGVGPEIVAMALSKPHIYEISRPLVVGDAKTMERAVEIIKGDLKVRAISKPEDARYEFGTMDVLDLKNVDLDKLKYATVDAMCGKAAAETFIEAIELAQAGKVAAIATAPLRKDAMNLGGYHYTGHTEILADKTATTDYAMMLAAGNLRVLHVTTHCSLQDAINRIKRARVLKVIELAHETGKAMGIEKPIIAVAGLNPHAGEGGMFGREDIEEIEPAIKDAQAEGIDARGPFPPDTVFLRNKMGQFDFSIAMFHDQGHIALKMFGFDQGINVSLGMPVIRTSVDHGTVYGKAGKGTANPASMIEAIESAVQFARGRAKAAGKA